MVAEFAAAGSDMNTSYASLPILLLVVAAVLYLALGDLGEGLFLLAGEGDRLAADGVLVAGGALSIDESALTGESAPVSKLPATYPDRLKEEALPGAVFSSFLFAGTLIVRGQAIVQVTRTGAQSAIGRIGTSLKSIARLRQQLRRFIG